MAPSVQKAYLEGGKIYGIAFPTEGMSIAKPTVNDAGGWPHFLEGGYTAVRLPRENPGYMVNSFHEFVTPGGNLASSGTVILELGEKGEWISLTRF